MVRIAPISESETTTITLSIVSRREKPPPSWPHTTAVSRTCERIETEITPAADQIIYHRSSVVLLFAAPSAFCASS